MTRRITPPTDPATGQRLSYQQRRDQRRKADRERRIEVRHAQAAAKAEAILNPQPAPLSFDERKAIRKAEDIGKAEAAEQAAIKAKEIAPAKNPYRERLKTIKLYRGPAEQRKFDHYAALADQWDNDRAAEQAAAERQALIDGDKSVILAREYAAGLVKLAPAEFQTEASEINGIAQAGDAAMAWSRMKLLEEKIWQHHDRLAVEKRASKVDTDAQFAEITKAAELARERFEQSAAMDAELNPVVDEGEGDGDE
jgi:hypothetical protein